ncbi:MAG: DUF934 domain-containing protein [Ottowia sp.]|uniref:DUF934 domain-containing protein n=1 Tax=Ottowia sp. TaxID=1898956 RepID=UPI0039E431CE
MKIIAASADPTSTEAGKVLKIANDAELPEIAASGALQGVERIELDFPKFTDGRAFSQAVLLRRRYGFAGDLRATGDVLVDQLVQMERSGFTSAVLAEGQSLETAERQFARYRAFYQGDALQPRPLFARDGAREAA